MAVTDKARAMRYWPEHDLVLTLVGQGLNHRAIGVALNRPRQAVSSYLARHGIDTESALKVRARGTTAPERKTCVVCERSYQRPVGETEERWRKRGTCGDPVCAGVWRSRRYLAGCYEAQTHARPGGGAIISRPSLGDYAPSAGLVAQLASLPECEVHMLSDEALEMWRRLRRAS